MRLIKFAIALIITIGLSYILNTSLSVSGSPIPPLGKLLSPFTGFWQNAESIKNPKNIDLNLSGLTTPVRVDYDDKMVPHIFAENMKDALFTQGYVTAQHRLWQLDISTREISGRLSEIMGDRLLNYDKVKRRQGFVFAAQNAIKAWKRYPENYELLTAYTNGVNAYIETLEPKDYPLEFKILNYEPEPWSNLKTALFSKTMAYYLSGRQTDLEATNALEVFGRETFDFLYPEVSPRESPIIPKGTKWDFEKIENNAPLLDPEPDTRIGKVYHRQLAQPDEHIGSNNWAVAGSKTASGNTILCNDPHLRLTVPAIWYELQINTPAVNCYGVSLPGVPGVIIGFNEDIAWGVTNVGHDAMDWYQIEWTDEQKESYFLDGNIEPVEKRIERFNVKGIGIVQDTVKYTKWGPVVYESKGNPRHDMAIRWVSHDVPTTNEMDAFLRLNKGKNYDDYIAALKEYNTPPQNFAFASNTGDIALKVAGKLPIKQKEQGRFIQQGNKSQNAWSGFIPKEQTPQIKNPERGFVASANQRSADMDYPYYYNGGFGDYRGRYLNRKLATMENITAKDMMALQNDNGSLEAEEALPLLLKQLDRTGLLKEQIEVINLLEKWNYQFEGESNIPVYFNEWWSLFLKYTWDEIYTLKDSMDILIPESWRTIIILEEEPNNVFFDLKSTPEVETAKEIATRSFKDMWSALSGENKNGKTENWQNHKASKVGHLGNISAFSIENLAIGGDKSALNAMRKTAGPSWRMIVELGDYPKAYGVYPGGQSGNPGSPYYDDMIDYFVKGKYYQLLFMKNKSEQSDRIIYSTNFNTK